MRIYNIQNLFLEIHERSLFYPFHLKARAHCDVGHREIVLAAVFLLYDSDGFLVPFCRCGEHVCHGIRINGKIVSFGILRLDE